MTDDFIKRGSKLHIGLIPDGNRRYAIKRKEPPWRGHWYGAEKIEEFINWSFNKPEIKIISIFTLSTDNIKRSGREVKELWKVYNKKFSELLNHPKVTNNEVKVNILGNDGFWEPNMRGVVNEFIKSTKSYSKHVLNFMLAYGSKFEINNAVRKMIEKPLKTLDRALLVKEPLNLIVRTGDQCRLSNFMLYQASYANIYFEKKLWPEVTKKDFEKWINWYYEQENKFGE